MSTSIPTPGGSASPGLPPSVPVPLAERLARLQAAGRQVESLAADYHATLRPLRETLQAVADASLENRLQWADAVSGLARQLTMDGMRDVPRSLIAVPRWEKVFDAGQPGRAFAGQAFCESLAGLIADGTPLSGFFAVLDSHKFITFAVATREICDVLSHLLFLRTERTVPEFTERFAIIVTGTGMDAEQLRLRLAQCCLPLSAEAEVAIHEWDEYCTGLPFYEVDIRPSAPTPAVANPISSTGSTTVQVTRIASILNHHNQRLQVDLDTCPVRGLAVTPSYLSRTPERLCCSWLVERLQAGRVMELRQMPNGDWFVLEQGSVEGVVINGDQLRDLQPWSGTTTTTAGPLVPNADHRLDGVYEEHGQFVIRWKGDRIVCDTSEEQVWRIIKHMWPPVDRKEASIAEVKEAIKSTATHDKWGTNTASKVKQFLLRVPMGFEMNCVSENAQGIEVFRWKQVSG